MSNGGGMEDHCSKTRIFEEVQIILCIDIIWKSSDFYNFLNSAREHSNILTIFTQCQIVYIFLSHFKNAFKKTYKIYDQWSTLYIRTKEGKIKTTNIKFSHVPLRERERHVLKYLKSNIFNNTPEQTIHPRKQNQFFVDDKILWFTRTIQQQQRWRRRRRRRISKEQT